MGLTIPFAPEISAEAVWAYATRILTNPAAAQDLLNMLVGISPTATGRAAYLDNINNPQLLTLPNVSVMEHEIEFPSAEALDDIAVVAATPTTERTITVALPAGASIRRVLLIALVTAMNNTANAQKIDVTVQGRKGAGGWSNFFSQTDCMGMGGVDGATTPLVAVQDVSALVNEEATYGFRLTITQSSANSVRYTTQFVLVLAYRMS